MSNNHTIDFRFAPALHLTWTCIGRPDDPYKSLVRGDGALLYEYSGNPSNPNGGNAGSPFGRTIEFRLNTDDAPIETEQFSDNSNNNIVVTVLRYPKATLTLKTFGHQHDGNLRTDIVLWSIEAAADVRAFMSSLWITETAVPIDDRLRVGIVSSPQALTHCWSYDQGAGMGYSHEPVLLSAGEQVKGVVVVPQNHALTRQMNLNWAKNAFEREREFWHGFPARRIELDVPDTSVMEMLAACARNIMQAREIKDGLPEFQVGPSIYRGLWVVDGHFIMDTARYLGMSAEADQGLSALLRRVRANGAISQMEFHDKETGISLASLVRQAELSGDWETLKGRWPIVQRAVAYIRTLRDDARKLPVSNPAHGLMPPGFADGGMSGSRPEYTTALWTMVGLKQAAHAAEKLEFGDDAAAFQRDFDELMADFRRCAARDIRTLPDGLPYLPMNIPGGSSDHKIDPDFVDAVPPWNRINPGTSTWALCHAIYPGEIFEPEDPLVKNLLALYSRIDKQEGIPAETGWLPFQSLWTYHAGFAAQAFIYGRKPEKAVDYLYAFANHASTTRVWREEQSLKDSGIGFAWGDMPHNWASAEFIRLVRHLIVFERGDTLEILPGVPAAWLGPDTKITVERTPTRFGKVTVEVKTNADGNGTIHIKRDLTWPTPAKEATVHLPKGLIFESNYPLIDGALVLPNDTEVTVGFRRG